MRLCLKHFLADSVHIHTRWWLNACNVAPVHVQGNSLQAEVQLQVRFLEPARALTPQQAFVMYDGDVCLGSALVQHPGPSLHELGK